MRGKENVWHKVGWCGKHDEYFIATEAPCPVCIKEESHDTN